MPNKYLHIDGVATYLHHLGPTTLPEERPDLDRGEALLYLHGAGGNGSFFMPLAERLAERHSPIAFDQPGHARSGGLDSLGSIERMAAFAKAVADALVLERPVLVGHSMGGAVAMRYALDYPDAVRALVLIGTAPRFPLPEERIEQVRRVTEGKARREITRDAYSPATPPDVVRRGIMEDLKTDPRVGLGDMLACREWDAGDALGRIALPALVIAGEEEFEPLRAAADALAQALPDARRVAVPKAGHMAHFEQPDAVADAVLAFLEQLP